MGTFFETLGLLLVFGFIVLLCYYTTRIIGKKFSGGTKNKNMKIVETLPLGMDKCLYLILVGKKHFLFFSGKKGLEMVTEIEIEEQTEDNLNTDDKTANVSEFKRIFETYSGLSRRADKKQASGLEEEPGEPENTGIMGSIKRLKKINAKNN